MLKYAVAAIALSITAMPALAGPDAEALVEETSRTLKETGITQKTLDSSVDIQGVANFTLGKYSRRYSDEERAKFKNAFKQFLLDTINENKNLISGADIEVINSIDRDENDSIVETRVTNDGRETTTVRWRVIQSDGDWKIVDVQWNGLWLAIEQRAQIAAILDKPRATIDDAIAALKS